MMKIYFETIVHQNFEKVVTGFDERLFRALTPPGVEFNLLRYEGSKTGDRIELEINLWSKKYHWTSLINDHGAHENEMWFVDVGEKLPPPLASWRHRHSVVRLSQFKSKIIDDIEYKSTHKLTELAIYPVLYAQFAYRIPIYKRYFNTFNPS